jgi:hypothetical protein
VSGPQVQIGRLALRHEGENWNAYYALTDTMDGAVFLGSIRMGAVISNTRRRQHFMNLMRDVVSDILKDATGQQPTWPNAPQPAPEHERSGHG